MEAPVGKMRAAEAIIAPASQDMQETTALQSDKAARWMTNCASMVDNVSVERLATHACVLTNIQDSSVRWSLKFLFSTRKHLLVLIMTVSMESAWPKKVLIMVTHVSVIRATRVKSVSTSPQCSWLEKTHSLNWTH